MPSWLSWAGALVTSAVVLFYGARLVLACLRRTQVSWDNEVLHFGMGVAMVAMFDGKFAFVPNVAWFVVFCAGGLWFAGSTFLVARRALTRQLVGNGLVHVGGCTAMASMLVVVPSKGGLSDVADLICGIHGVQATGMQGMPGMQGMQGGMSGGAAVTPWTFIAVCLAVALLAGVVCLAPVTRRAMVAGTRPSFRRAGSSPVGIVNSALTSTHLVSTAQVAMFVTMTVMLVAMYR
jgi:hypothetical protein